MKLFVYLLIVILISGCTQMDITGDYTRYDALPSYYNIKVIKLDKKHYIVTTPNGNYEYERYDNKLIRNFEGRIFLLEWFAKDSITDNQYIYFRKVK